MRDTIKSAPNFASYPSFDKIAQALLDLPDSVFKKSGNAGRSISVRSLAAMIGNLNRGDGTWWAKRADETKYLAKLLGIGLDELGLNQKSGRHIFDFATFAELPPLDLIREDAWKIAEPRIAFDPEHHTYNNPPTLDGWLKSTGYCRRDEVEWLYVPDEVEYGLLTRKLAAASRHEVLSIKSLADVFKNDTKLERILQDDSLILAIETSMTLEDVQTLAQYRQGAALLIVSLSQLPPPKESTATLKTPTKINRWTWTLMPKWRELLLGWVHNRINGNERAKDHSSFSDDAAQSLLDKFDPRHLLFVSVKDVLVLCHALYKNSEKQFKTNGNDEQLLSLFEPNEQSSDMLSALVQARWKRWDLSWAGELPQDDWIALAKDLCKFNDLTQHLIVRGATGYDFQRSIVIRLLVRRYLRKKLIEGDLTSWAPACFDRERRPMVDDALDAISLNELEVVARKFMRESTSRQDVGACEAIFIAIGRRIIRKQTVSNELSEFAGHLIKQLIWDEQDKDFLRPWSLRVEEPKVHMEWVSACWAWSLQPAPPMGIPSSWLFPGWSSSLPQKVPQWLNGSRTNQNYFSSNWERQAIPLKDFLTVVERCMEKLDAPQKYQDAPPLFSIALLARAASSDLEIEAWWWSSVIGDYGSPLAAQALLDLVRSEEKSENRLTAFNWWPSLVQYFRKHIQNERPFSSRQTVSDLFTRNHQIKGYSELVVWVMEQLKDHSREALEALQGEDRRFLAMHPTALPVSFKRELLKWLSKGIPSEWMPFQLLDLLSHYGREVVQEMEVFLNGSEQLAPQAAWHIWDWAPDRAIQLLSEPPSQEAAQHLIWSCPPSALDAAIKLLKNNPALLQEKRLLWARRHLPDARQHAQALMELIDQDAQKTSP